MNDCVWTYIVDCEEGCKCCGYRSMNSEEGAKIMLQFESEVQETLQPLKEKWKKYFESNEW